MSVRSAVEVSFDIEDRAIELPKTTKNWNEYNLDLVVVTPQLATYDLEVLLGRFDAHIRNIRSIRAEIQKIQQCLLEQNQRSQHFRDFVRETARDFIETLRNS